MQNKKGMLKYLVKSQELDKLREKSQKTSEESDIIDPSLLRLALKAVEKSPPHRCTVAWDIVREVAKGGIDNSDELWSWAEGVKNRAYLGTVACSTDIKLEPRPKDKNEAQSETTCEDPSNTTQRSASKRMCSLSMLDFLYSEIDQELRECARAIKEKTKEWICTNCKKRLRVSDENELCFTCSQSSGGASEGKT